MTSSYALRLVCLSLAVSLLVNLLVSLAVGLCAPVIIRRVEQWRAASAARMMLLLRLLPAASALFVVFAVCIPSYLLLEPQAMEEEIGAACLISAALGAAAWAFSLLRTGRAVVRSAQYMRGWRRRGVETAIGDTRVWVIDGAGRTLALAGIFRPELIVSEEVVRALPEDQLAAALRHERAHASAWDNFKRLTILLAPSIAPMGRVERAWARFTEWSADDRAAGGDARQSVLLAAALVSVARMGSSAVPPLATALMAGTEDLEARIERLLRDRRDASPVPFTLVAAGLASAGAAFALALHPGTLSIAYRILERLVD